MSKSTNSNGFIKKLSTLLDVSKILRWSPLCRWYALFKVSDVTFQNERYQLRMKHPQFSFTDHLKIISDKIWVLSFYWFKLPSTFCHGWDAKASLVADALWEFNFSWTNQILQPFISTKIATHHANSIPFVGHFNYCCISIQKIGNLYIFHFTSALWTIWKLSPYQSQFVCYSMNRKLIFYYD